MHSLIKQIFPYYQNIRRQIHANPELRYEEYKTAYLVAKELEKLGLPVQTNIGKTGVVALLDSGNPGKTIALRADMDALPIHEETGLPYQSKNAGIMHACGHDGHTATLLAVAHILTKMKSSLSGKVKFVFQPAEEGGAGAKAMIDDGVLMNPEVDAIFAYHNHPGSPLGTVLVRNGCTLNGNCGFDICVRGKGGHAAQPEKVINPNIALAKIICELEPYCVSLSQESEPSILAISQLSSGTIRNVIPDIATISGTIRVPSLEKLDEIKHRLQQVLQLVAKQTQTSIKIDFTQMCPPTINSTVETQYVMNHAKLLFGENRVQIKPKPARASEDFSYFLQKVPGCYFFVGNGDSHFCHNSHYDFNDEVMFTAVHLLATLALGFVKIVAKTRQHC
ncbi:MAG: M20 family metallopeptidase [Candidatus Berkiella sp.]